MFNRFPENIMPLGDTQATEKNALVFKKGNTKHSQEQTL